MTVTPTVPPAQGGPASLALAPSSGSLTCGASLVIDLLLDTGGREIAGYDAVLLYDPMRLRVDSVTGGTLGLGLIGVVRDNTQGVTKIGGIASPDQPFQGTGVAASITVSPAPGAPPGMATLRFDYDPSNPGKTTDSNVVDSITITDLLGSVTGGAYLVPACSSTVTPTATVTATSTTTATSTASPSATQTSTPTVTATSTPATTMGGGTVFAWGNNGSGQLGDRTTSSRTTPAQVTGITSATMLAGGYSHGLAVTNDGLLWAWGDNSYGQLGDGSTNDRFSPGPVTGLSGVTHVAAANAQSLAVTGDGAVWAWGNNFRGQLGDGTTTNRGIPAQVVGISNVTSVAAGTLHSLALRNDGTVWSWGLNENGQLGDGTTTDRSVPVQVIGVSSVAAIAAGSRHSIALKSDGTVWAWGLNEAGQLGDGTFVNRSSPVQVAGLASVVAVAGSNAHSVALKADGTVWTWGYNVASAAYEATAAQVTGLSGITALAAGVGYNYSLALRGDGTVWGWGWNIDGALGDGTTMTRSTPVQVTGLSGATAVTVGFTFGMAVSTSATVPPLPTPTNDNFLGAQTLPVPTVVSGSTRGATLESGERRPCGSIGGTVWFRLAPTVAGTLTASTAGSGFDTVLALYSGSALASLNSLTCNDDFGFSARSQVSAAVSPGQTYYLQLGGQGIAAGDFVLSISQEPIT